MADETEVTVPVTEEPKAAPAKKAKAAVAPTPTVRDLKKGETVKLNSGSVYKAS